MNENNNDDWVLSIINAANNNMKNEYTNSPMINNMVSDTFSQPQMPSQRPLSYSSPTQSSPQQQSASPQQQTDSVIQKSSIAQMIAPYAADYEKYFGEETRRDPHYNMLYVNESNKNLINNYLPQYNELFDLFTFENGQYYYNYNSSNGKIIKSPLFYFNVIDCTVCVRKTSHEPSLIIIKYSTNTLNGIAIIPFEHFKSKKLKDHFIIHELLKFTPNKNNVINEYLYMQITRSFTSPSILYLFPNQGWNQFDDKTVFISSALYPPFLRDYLSESVRNRFLPYKELHQCDPLKDLSEIIPLTFEVKLMLTIRMISLLLFQMKLLNIIPQQIFLFESADQITLKIASYLLNTNSNSIFPTLGDRPEKLNEYCNQIYDGVCVTLDHSQITLHQRDTAINTLIKDMVTNNYSPDSPRHLYVILSETSGYLKDSEKILYLHLPDIIPKANINRLSPILEEFDSLIINKFSDNSMNAQNSADIALEINSYDVIHSNSNISTERRSTYSLIYQGILLFQKLFPEIIDDGFKEKLDSWIRFIDRSGYNQEFDIVNQFAKVLDDVINRDDIFVSYLFPSQAIDKEVETILHNDEYIFLHTDFIDKYVLPLLDSGITHRQLIRALDASQMLKKTDHFTHRLSSYDEYGDYVIIYRYAIKKEILNKNKLQKINNTKNEEFFLEKEYMPKKNFIPLLTDKYSDRHVVRCIETGMKANNHILITGEPGTGKSFFMIRTASYLAAMEQKIIILDSNGSEALNELLDILPEDIVNDSIDIIDIENGKFPIDPFCIKNIKRKDSKANFISDILLSAAYDATDAQADKLKSLILENIDKLIVEDVISPDEIKKLLINDGPILSSLRDKLHPLLAHLQDNINYEQTWETILERPENIIVFSIDAHLEKRGKKIFDILLASLYNYHIKHKNRNIWICIDEIQDQNLKESGIINRIFTQGRKNRINIIAATHNFRLSRSEEWTTLNNAATKVFFKPPSSAISDVMKELDLKQSERHLLSQMNTGECFISSELYSKLAMTNQSAVVSGIVPQEYVKLKDLIPSEQQFDRPEPYEVQNKETSDHDAQ